MTSSFTIFFILARVAFPLSPLPLSWKLSFPPVEGLGLEYRGDRLSFPDPKLGEELRYWPSK